MWHKGLVGAFILMLALFVSAQSGSLGLPEDVSEYFRWTRANPQKNLEESAHAPIKDIYVNEAAVGGALEQSFPYAEGSVLIKERMDPETLSVSTLYAMRKVADFDPENGDWQYGVFEREDTGTFGGGWMSAENAAMCVGCHLNAADKDYTFLSYRGK